MWQHDIWCVYVCCIWRGMLDCTFRHTSLQIEHTHTHQMLCCRITTLNFTFLTNFKISDFNKEYMSS